MAVIEVSDLHKRYGPRVAVEDISFAVEEGEIFGILGPNGAGKTTTVETIAGLRTPDRGSVEVMGMNPWKQRTKLRRVLGIQLQESKLPDKITVQEALDLYASFYEKPVRWQDLLEVLGLTQQRAVAYGKLSGGQQQRLNVALALVGDPRVAVLDEVTTGLDPQARRDAWDVIAGIRDRGVTIVLVTHFLEEAERLADRVAVIDKGRVVALDSPDAITAATQAEQRLRFRPSQPVDVASLEALPQVREVGTSTAGIVTVTGTDDMVQAVLGVLARQQITAAELRVDQTTLDDAYVALIGKDAS